MNNKFESFLTSMHDVDPILIDTIKEGLIIIESISTDDANGKPNGQTVTHPSPASAIDYIKPSTDYFQQTLPDDKNNIANMSQMGARIAQMPPVGRTSTGKDALKSNETSNYSASYGES